jgi:hypothetical protein
MRARSQAYGGQPVTMARRGRRHVAEDSPGFNPYTMGNKRAGFWYGATHPIRRG